MNALNLTHINEKSAYKVWQTSEGDFNFQTDFDVLYRISFRIEQTITAENVTNYTAMIVQRTNPQLETIIKDFDDFIGFFQNKPQ